MPNEQPSADEHDDSPSVIGGKPSPVPTDAEYREAFKRAFIARFVEVGVPEHIAQQEFDGAPWDDIKEMPPDLAADTAMEVWDVE